MGKKHKKFRQQKHCNDLVTGKSITNHFYFINFNGDNSTANVGSTFNNPPPALPQKTLGQQIKSFFNKFSWLVDTIKKIFFLLMMLLETGLPLH